MSRWRHRLGGIVLIGGIVPKEPPASAPVFPAPKEEDDNE